MTQMKAQIWRWRQWLRSGERGLVRPHYKVWNVAKVCIRADIAFLRFSWRLTRCHYVCGTWIPRHESMAYALALWRYSTLPARYRRRAKRILRRTARRHPGAAHLYASIASPIGMGNDGQKAYDLATRTWFGTHVGAIQALGKPWYDPTAAALGGALPDGIHDTVPAVQQTVTAMLPTLGGILFLVTGVWLFVTGPVVLAGHNDITLWGSGANTSTAPTRIKSSAANAQFSLGDGVAAGNDYLGKLTLRGVIFDGNNLNADLWQNKNLATQPGRYHFDGIVFWAFGTGYAFHDAINNMESVDSMWNDVDVAFGKFAINLRNGVWIMTNCTFGFMSSAGTAAIQLFGNNKSSFYGCVWTTNVDDVVVAETGGVVYTNPFRFSGCWFENCTDACLTNANAANQVDIAYDTCRLHTNGGTHIFWNGSNSLLNLRNVDFALQTIKITLSNSGNTLIAEDCRQINRQAKLASPFNTTRNFLSPTVSADAYQAAPVASTAYQVNCCKGMVLIITGGTGVAISLTDRLGTNATVLGGGGTTPQNLYVPVGHSINFGAFSVAPTVVAFVQ